MNDVKFEGWLCYVQLAKYGNGRTAIQLMDYDDASPVATASVNLPDVEMADDEVAIKDWSENEGMLSALLDAGIVAPPVRLELSGFVVVPICKFLGETP